MRAVHTDLNAFLHVSEEEALTTARDVDARRSAGEELHPLAGVPIAVKDVAVTEGIPTTAGSKMLERSEEHTSELQSRGHLVCRLLLKKKKSTCISSRLPYTH